MSFPARLVQHPFHMKSEPKNYFETGLPRLCCSSDSWLCRGVRPKTASVALRPLPPSISSVPEFAEKSGWHHLQLLLQRPLARQREDQYLALKSHAALCLCCYAGSCLFLFLCFLHCRPRRLLLPALTFATVSAAALRPRAPVRLLQRVSRTCKSKRFATGAALRCQRRPGLARVPAREWLLYLEANVRLLPLEFRDALAWRHPRLPIIRTFGPRCWQRFKRLSTGTSMWCQPETSCPAHRVVACCMLLRCHLLPRAPSLRTLLSQAPAPHRLHARAAMLASALQVLLTSRTLTRTSPSLDGRRGLISILV